MKKLFVALMTASMLFVLFSCNNKNTPELTNSITLSTDTIKNNYATAGLFRLKIADITVAPEWIDYELQNTTLHWSEEDQTLTVDGEVIYNGGPGFQPLQYYINRNTKTLEMTVDLERKECDQYIEVKPPRTFKFYTPNSANPVQLCEAHLDETYTYTLDGERVELTGVEDTPTTYELMHLDIAVLTGIADIDTIELMYAHPRNVNHRLLVDGVDVPIDGEKIQLSYYINKDDMTMTMNILGLDRTPTASTITIHIDGTFEISVSRRYGNGGSYTGYLDTEYRCTLSGTEMTLTGKALGGRVDSLDNLKIATISYQDCFAGGGLNNALVTFEGTETLYVNNVETPIDGETINITYYSPGQALLAAITGVDRIAGQELGITLKLDGTFTFTTTGTYGTAVYEAPLTLTYQCYVPAQQ